MANERKARVVDLKSEQEVLKSEQEGTRLVKTHQFARHRFNMQHTVFIKPAKPLLTISATVHRRVWPGLGYDLVSSANLHAE